MIWGASTFNNELDVLEIRLETLKDVVDRWVLAEATVTQRGTPKPLHFEENKDRFSAYPIEHIVVEDLPGGEGYEMDWARERAQRNALGRVLKEVSPGDQILISDLDEIPSPESLERGLNMDFPVKFNMDMHVYRLNWRWLDRGCQIGSTAAVFHADDLPMRLIHDVLLGSHAQVIESISGWHLSYMGDVAHIRNKMTTMADNFYEQLIPTEYKDEGWRPEDFLTDSWIQSSIETGRDVYGREYRPSEWVDLDQLPPPVQKNPERYEHLMVPRPEGVHHGPRCSCGGAFDLTGRLAHYPKCQLYGVRGELRVEDGVFA